MSSLPTFLLLLVAVHCTTVPNFKRPAYAQYNYTSTFSSTLTT